VTGYRDKYRPVYRPLHSSSAMPIFFVHYS